MNPTDHQDTEELEILQAWEAGTLKPVSDLAQQLAAHRRVADATFKKDQRMHIKEKRVASHFFCLFHAVFGSMTHNTCAHNPVRTGAPA